MKFNEGLGTKNTYQAVCDSQSWQGIYRNALGPTPVDKYCKDCIYYDSQHICDYIGITHHARILICPPGKACTVRVLKEDAKKKRTQKAMKVSRRKKPKAAETPSDG